MPTNNFFAHRLLRARSWQHRPQLDELCNWWRKGGARGGVGVCSLIGIGGAGKTAIADRFLQLLPEVLPPNPDVPKDTTLAVPNSVFVFSFYDAPNPEAFFDALKAWLRQTFPTYLQTRISKSGRTSYHEVIQWLQGAPPGLLILDGLERIQQDGTRGGILGRLSDGNLRDFLGRVASGYLPHLSAVITSRFPLADLEEASPTHYQAIDVDEIELQTGIDLLRKRGVTGSDDQLAIVVENCGRHALTVDMAGGLLVEFHDGNPTTNLEIGTPEEIEQAANKETNARRRATKKQELRFAKVATRYRESLVKRDKAALALLERVCLFRLGVDTETLTSIFTGKGSQKAAGRALSRLSPDKLQEKLGRLVGMGLLESTPRNPTRQRGRSGYTDSASLTPLATSHDTPILIYSIHPAVRDGFLKGISNDARLSGHEAVRKGLEVSLGDAPGENPSDPATLDLLEEIVHHTLQSGHVCEAWDFYENRIGQYENLGWRLGAYERGERICRAFAGGQSAETVVSQYQHEAEASESASSGDPGTHSLARRDRTEEAAGPSHPDGGEQGIPPSSTSEHSSLAALPPATRSDGLRPDEAPFLDLPEATQAIFINEWALYLRNLGRLAAAARCYELYVEMSMWREDWTNASIGNQNLCDVWLLSGRLSRLPQAEGGRTAAVNRRQDETDESLPPSSFVARPSEASPATSARLGASSVGALATADEALRLADEATRRCSSHAYRGYAHALRGEVAAAMTDFQATLDWQHKRETHVPDRPLYGNRGYWHTNLLARLGRREEGMYLTAANWKICLATGPDHFDIPKCQLVLSSLSIDRSVSGSSSSSSSADLWTQARGWALARDAKEVLCWSYLVEAQHALANAQRERQGANRRSNEQPHHAEPAASASPLTQAHTALESGLKIARDCGYGLYHIDLLLERAQLNLMRGDAESALVDIELALDTGIPANEETGQPELLAALHPACGYAWPIPFGLQLRAEALLLQAAQDLCDNKYVPALLEELPTEVKEKIAEAESHLKDAFELWQPLHDPEPERDDQNFKLDGKEYNYKAAETHRVLTELKGGLLTQYPLEPLHVEQEGEKPEPSELTSVKPKKDVTTTSTTKRAEANSMPDTEITWLHLSDAHLRPKSKWDHKRVLKTLLKDLKEREEKDGLAPDMLFFSGDLVFGQTSEEPISEQFQDGLAFLDAVRNAFRTPIAIENTFIVPGNHDVNRSVVADMETDWLDNKSDPDEIVKLIQDGDQDWKRYMARLTDYQNALEAGGYGHLLTDPSRLIYAVERTINGVTVGITGLNSAWSCARNGENGKLWMAAKWQFGELAFGEDPDLKIAVVHHPFDWIREEEQPPKLWAQIEGDHHFCLHGHEHSGWVRQIGDSHVRISSAACYDRSDHENGYNFVRLNLTQGNGEIWLRKYIPDGSGGWGPRFVPGNTKNDGVWKITNVPALVNP